MPMRRIRSSWPGLVGTSRARMPPLRQRSAAAVSTPSGAPPIPMTTWTLVRRTAAVIPADRPPSRISLMRAPACRLSAISFSCRARSITMTTRSRTPPDLLPDVEHRRLVALTLADHHRAAHGQAVHRLPHRLDGDVVGEAAVALPHRARRVDRRLLAYAQELARERLAGRLRGRLLVRRHLVFPA